MDGLTAVTKRRERRLVRALVYPKNTAALEELARASVPHALKVAGARMGDKEISGGGGLEVPNSAPLGSE